MAAKSETYLVRKIIKHLKEHHDFDGYHVHGSAMQRAGEPDIDGSVYARGSWLHLKIEVKTPEGSPTQLQIQRIRNYHERGYVAGIVTDVHEVMTLVAAWAEYSSGTPLFPIRHYLETYGVSDPYDLYEE